MHTLAMAALYRDRADAGTAIGMVLAHLDLGDAVVVGLARGGVAVASAVAQPLSLPLDAVAVRKIGHPRQPEYGLGAVAPGERGVFLRTTEDLDEVEIERAIERATTQAEALDAALHAQHRPVALRGRTAVLVDDGLATGATMVAAVRWARGEGATRVVVAVPVGSAQGVRLLEAEADEVICPHVRRSLGAVGFWYDDFGQLETREVIALLDAHAGAEP